MHANRGVGPRERRYLLADVPPLEHVHHGLVDPGAQRLPLGDQRAVRPGRRARPVECPMQRALIACLVNSDQVFALLQVPGQRFQASYRNSQTVAATALQARVRGMLSRRMLLHNCKQSRAADRLTRKVKSKMQERAARQKIDEVTAAEQLAWEAMNTRFRKDWPRIRSSPRVIVHLASISATPTQRSSMPNLQLRQNVQLPRLCDVKEPGVDVIYVAPFPVLALKASDLIRA